MPRALLLTAAFTLALLCAGARADDEKKPDQKKADPIVGTYDWFSGAEFVIRADSTATATLDGKKYAVRWTANPYGGYVLMYEEGGVDIVKFNDDFDKLEGTGVTRGKAYPVSGKKR